MGAVSFVQRFGSTLNAHVHFHCWVIDGVFVAGADGQVQFAEAAALRPEDLAAAAAAGAATGAALVRPCQPSRCCRCARHGELGSRRRLLAPAASLNAGKAALACTETSLSLRFRWMLRSASKAPTAPAWNGCCAIARGRPLRWSASSSSARMRSSIASTSRSPMGVPSCG